NDVKIWGYDLVDPKDEFSVAQYIKFAREVIKDIHKRNKLPILVGGTGFYIKSVVEGIGTAEIPQNKALRKNLKKIPKDELFEKLAILDSSKAGSLNKSDKNNPRRLFRAIEIAIWKLSNLGLQNKEEKFDYDTFFIGLNMPKQALHKKIKVRVDKRVKGVKKEISYLLKQGIDWSSQSMSSLGYRQWKEYFEGKETEGMAINKWFLEEKKYSKRQITWFKKNKKISWYSINSLKWKEDVEKFIEKWYSSG
ncbi:MAG: tRNA dimethylallyltransferase, partial [Patescibacteria group bacterium]